MIQDQVDRRYRARVRKNMVVDNLMPLYLSEELSPRFAGHKVADAWKARQALRSRIRIEKGEMAVEAWRKGGRDVGLRAIMDSDEAGLEGVPLRPRTREEVRSAALAEHDEEAAIEKKYVSAQIASGMTWDMGKGAWVAGHKARRAHRKKEKKARKRINLESRMRDLKLKEGKNMVLPADAVDRGPEGAQVHAS